MDVVQSILPELQLNSFLLQFHMSVGNTMNLEILLLLTKIAGMCFRLIFYDSRTMVLLKHVKVKKVVQLGTEAMAKQKQVQQLIQLIYSYLYTC